SGVDPPLIGKQGVESRLPIPLTGSPNGGFIAPELSGEVFAPLACGDPQNNARTPDLIPGGRVTVSDPLQLGDIRREDRQYLGLAAAHIGTLHAEIEHHLRISGCSNSVQLFVPATLVAVILAANARLQQQRDYADARRREAEAQSREAQAQREQALANLRL